MPNTRQILELWLLTTILSLFSFFKGSRNIINLLTKYPIIDISYHVIN